MRRLQGRSNLCVRVARLRCQARPVLLPVRSRLVRATPPTRAAPGMLDVQVAWIRYTSSSGPVEGEEVVTVHHEYLPISL